MHLPATLIHEEMVARKMPYYELDMDVMKATLDHALEEMWSHRFGETPLPTLEREVITFESIMCLNRWQYIQDHYERRSAIQNQIHNEVEKITWSLLLLRLNRLLGCKPVNQHREAFYGLRSFLVRKYGFDYRILPARVNPLPPIELGKRKEMTPESDVLDLDTSPLESPRADPCERVSKSKKRRLRRKRMAEKLGARVPAGDASL